MSLSIERKRSIGIGHSRQPSVGVSVCVCVCPVHCGKTPERIRMPFGIGRSDGFRDEADGDRVWGSVHGKKQFLGEFGAPHCNQWKLCSVPVRKCVNGLSCGLEWCVGSTEALQY